ncbi:MAG: 50S ribosomal protein L6 [Candidatus Altiarchaeales archaeon ex4484_96]|nr:MAG: 50S ribosomal protein L6 [Candidatus Altiarchaeales archaeon ex4484_96]
MHDLLNDAIINIKNRERVGKKQCIVKPVSRLLIDILRIFQKEGYIGEFELEEDGRGNNIKIKLIHRINDCGVIKPRYPITNRRVKSLLGTARGNIQNMFRGATEGIDYKLKILYSHFPMNVKVQGQSVVIENFIGEKHPRKSKILDNVNVEIKQQDITVSGIDKEKVAQTAANMEQATKISNLDPRVFQDGIYIVEKDGKPIE